MTFLNGVAVILQVVGLIVTAIGLRFTWQEFHEPNERFRDPFIRAVRRLNFRGRRGSSVNAGLADAVGVAMDASAQITFGPLPDDDRAAIDQLAQRLQELRRNFETTTTDIRRDIGTVTRRIDSLEGHVTTEVDRLDRADRHVATDGLRLESFGLVIIAAGTLVQLIDTLMR